LRERLLRVERDAAVERIGGVDRLHLDQRGAVIIGAFTRVVRRAIRAFTRVFRRGISAFTRVFRRAMRGMRHGTHGGRERHPALAGQKCAFRRAGFAQA
jgi:hypothetical protein